MSFVPCARSSGRCPNELCRTQEQARDEGLAVSSSLHLSHITRTTERAPQSATTQASRLTAEQTNMEALPTMNVCRSCRALLRQSKDRNQLRYTSRRTLSWAATPAHEPKPRRIRASQAPAHTRLRPYASPAAPHRSASGDNISAQHQRVQELGSSVLQTEDGKLPEEQRILYVFEQYEQIASSLLDPRKRSSARTSRADTTATSALLGSVNAKQQPHFITRKLVLSAI